MRSIYAGRAARPVTRVTDPENLFGVSGAAPAQSCGAVAAASFAAAAELPSGLMARMVMANW